MGGLVVDLGCALVSFPASLASAGLLGGLGSVGREGGVPSGPRVGGIPRLCSGPGLDRQTEELVSLWKNSPFAVPHRSSPSSPCSLSTGGNTAPTAVSLRSFPISPDFSRPPWQFGARAFLPPFAHHWPSDHWVSPWQSPLLRQARQVPRVGPLRSSPIPIPFSSSPLPLCLAAPPSPCFALAWCLRWLLSPLTSCCATPQLCPSFCPSRLAGCAAPIVVPLRLSPISSLLPAFGFGTSALFLLSSFVASLGSPDLARGCPFVCGPACLLSAPLILAFPPLFSVAPPFFFALCVAAACTRSSPSSRALGSALAGLVGACWSWDLVGLAASLPSCLCVRRLCVAVSPYPLPLLFVLCFHSPRHPSGPRFVLWALVLRPCCPRPLPVCPGAFTTPFHLPLCAQVLRSPVVPPLNHLHQVMFRR